MADARKKLRLGDLLVNAGEITSEQLDRALKEQQRTRRKLGGTLVELGFLSEPELLGFLARQLDLPLIDLAHYNFNQETVRQLPEILARRYRAILLDIKEGEALVGMSDPTDLFGYDQLGRTLGAKINIAVVSEQAMLSTFDKVYRRTGEISNLAQELGQELSEGDFDINRLLADTDVSNAPVVKLLQTLFEDAVQVKASDVHIEPDEQVLRIRQRIDGVLHEQVMQEKRIAGALVSRLKVMASLDISERRMPQDGRFNIKVRNHAVDVRLSTMPTQHGESVVMRLLDQSAGLIGLERLGMPANMLQRFRAVLHVPHGLILVTGPTGSGKTTTLYAALQELNTPDRKIITVEDPVEYRLERINQVQVNSKIGLGFAQVLRATLRQDPDVVLIGEMRDQETVEIGLRAAMTGHLVLSTLHTNDAVSTADRMLDMGAEGYLVAASLRAVIAQRLVRRICTSCKTEHRSDVSEQSWLSSLGEPAGRVYWRGRGCAQCNNTGYSGRIGVYEYLEPTDAMLTALRHNDIGAFVQASKSARYFHTLGDSVLDYVRKGITSVDELLRVGGDVDAEEVLWDKPEETP